MDLLTEAGKNKNTRIFPKQGFAPNRKITHLPKQNQVYISSLRPSDPIGWAVGHMELGFLPGDPQQQGHHRGLTCGVDLGARSNGVKDGKAGKASPPSANIFYAVCSGICIGTIILHVSLCDWDPTCLSFQDVAALIIVDLCTAKWLVVALFCLSRVILLRKARCLMGHVDAPGTSTLLAPIVLSFKTHARPSGRPPARAPNA